MNNGRVIITYGRSLMALSAAHSLAKRGIEVIACDDVDMTVTKFSKSVYDYFTHAPYEDDEEQFLDDLEAQVIQHKPKDGRPYVLMPMFRDARIIAKHKARFEPHIIVATPDRSMIDAVHPKDAFSETCKRLNLNIPQTHQYHSIQELDEVQKDITFPVLIKPVDEKGGRGIEIVHDYETLSTHYNQILNDYGVPALIQHLADGDDYCLTAICNEGEIVESMAYRNLYKFPRRSGAGIMRETVDETPFLKDAEALLKDLKWHGVAQIDFMWTGNSQDNPVLIELNPRFWAGLFHSVESGADYPWLLYQLMVDGKITDLGHIELGKKTKVPGLWALSAFQEWSEDDAHFETIKKAWQDLWGNNKNKKMGERLKALKDAFDKDMNFDVFKHAGDQSREAVSEFDFDEDPFASFGFLFVISSLLKHGELPPELRS